MDMQKKQRGPLEESIASLSIAISRLDQADTKLYGRLEPVRVKTNLDEQAEPDKPEVVALACPTIESIRREIARLEAMAKHTEYLIEKELQV